MDNRLSDAELEHVRQLLLQYFVAMEDLWIEREAFKTMLRKDPNFEADLDKIAEVYKADPHWRKQARETYASFRKSLETAAARILFRDLAIKLPPRDPN